MNDLIKALEKADKICAKAAVHLDNIDRLENELASISIKKSDKLIIKWIAVGFLAMQISALLLSLLVQGVLGCEWLAGLAGLGSIVIGVYCGVSGYKKNYTRKLHRMDEIGNEIAAEQAAARRIFNANYEDMAFLPDEYWYPAATGYLLRMITSGRSVSLADALDHYDEYCHRMKIEQANNDIIAQQQAQTDHLGSIRKSNKVNAAANVANTVFNIASRL